MTAVWLCRIQGEEASCHESESEALAVADEHARANKVAIVWPVEVED